MTEQAAGVIEALARESTYTRRLSDLMNEQKIVMAERIPAYGDTWTEEGVDGLMYDIIRKMRRLWKVVMIDGKTPNRNDTVDLANYSLMLQALAEVNPGAVDRMRIKAVKGLFGTTVS